MRWSLVFLLGCGSSGSGVDGGADAIADTAATRGGAQSADASNDAANDAAMTACDPSMKPGDPMGGAVKTMAKTLVVVRTPPGYDPSVASPLVVFFAPAGGNPALDETFSGLTPPAQKRGYIVAYPDHITPQSAADFQNAASVIQLVMDNWCVDPKRVYLTGHSDGGSLSEILAMRGLAKPAAIAPSAAGVSGAYAAAQTCPKQPLPEMEIHSTGDQLFPTAQGFGGPVAAWWAKCDGCDPMPSAPDANNCVVYSSCMGMSEVRYCEGSAAHGVWPQRQVQILDFFDRFTLP